MLRPFLCFVERILVKKQVGSKSRISNCQVQLESMVSTDPKDGSCVSRHSQVSCVRCVTASQTKVWLPRIVCAANIASFGNYFMPGPEVGSEQTPVREPKTKGTFDLVLQDTTPLKCYKSTIYLLFICMRML